MYLPKCERNERTFLQSATVLVLGKDVSESQKVNLQRLGHLVQVVFLPEDEQAFQVSQESFSSPVPARVLPIVKQGDDNVRKTSLPRSEHQDHLNCWILGA